MSAEQQMFEIWASIKGLPLDRVISDERYESMETEWAWRAWKVRANFSLEF